MPISHKQLSYKEETIRKKWYEGNMRKNILHLQQIPLEEDKGDFLAEYLPFNNIDSLDKESINKILGYAWCIYNYKTIVIEQQILTKYCNMVISGESSYKVPGYFLERLCQVQIDECYHTLMSQIGIQRIHIFRSIDINDIKNITISLEMNRVRNFKKNDYELFLFSACLVCETTLTKYLSVFSRNKTAQPLCQKITELHRLDEGHHSNIFIELYKTIISELTEEDMKKLNTYINHIINLLSNNTDLLVWKDIYKKLNLTFDDTVNPKYNSIYNFSSLYRHCPEIIEQV